MKNKTLWIGVGAVVIIVIIAMLMFNEYQELNFSFILGITLIIISVVLQTWSKLKAKD